MIYVKKHHHILNEWGALPNLKFKKYFELAAPTNPGKKT